LRRENERLRARWPSWEKSTFFYHQARLLAPDPQADLKALRPGIPIPAHLLAQAPAERGRGPISVPQSKLLRQRRHAELLRPPQRRALPPRPIHQHRSPGISAARIHPLVTTPNGSRKPTNLFIPEVPVLSSGRGPQHFISSSGGPRAQYRRDQLPRVTRALGDYWRQGQPEGGPEIALRGQQRAVS
jgi:hypothetical protein